MSTPRELIKKLQAAGLAKRILPPKDTTSRTHNGATTYIPQIQKLILNYTPPTISTGGTSRGLVSYLTNRLPQLAKQRPYIEICVQPNARADYPPSVTALYANGKEKKIVVGKLNEKEVERKVLFLCDSADGEEKRVKRGQPVLRGGHEGKMSSRVEGVWDPFTARETFRP